MLVTIMFSPLVVVLFLSFFSVMGSEWYEHLAYDLASEFNAACLNILHVEGSVDKKELPLKLFKSLSKGQRDGKSLKLYSTLLLSFEEFQELGKTCYKPMVFVFATEKTKLEFSTLTYNARLSNSKWVIFMNETYLEETFFENADISFNAQVLTAKSHSGGAILKEVYRINSNFPLKINDLGFWNSDGRFSCNNLEKIYTRRYKLDGLVFKTGSIENYPMTTFITKSNGEEVLEGFFPAVWKELEIFLNFSSINLRSVDNSTGSFSNASWSGLIGMLVRDEIDAIVSELNMNEERYAVLDFSSPLLQTGYQVYFRVSGFNLKWSAVFDPFDTEVWFISILWMLLGAIALAVCFRLSRPYEPPSDMAIKPQFTIFFMLQSLCQQGYFQIPLSTACRIIFLMSYLVSSIMVPAYSASLISSLTAQTPNKPYNSLDEMLIFKNHKLLVAPNSAEYSLFEKSKDGLFQQVFINLIQPVKFKFRYMKEGLNLACQSDYAMFGVESVTDIKIEPFRAQGCELHKFSQFVSVVTQTLALKKNSSYTGLIDIYLRKMAAVGIIERIRQNVWPLKASKPDTIFFQVRFMEVMQIFTFLAIGIIVSVIILFLEITFGKNKKKVNVLIVKQRMKYSQSYLMN